jgi:RNA polymerase sigma factor (sigma-70 family)
LIPIGVYGKKGVRRRFSAIQSLVFLPTSCFAVATFNRDALSDRLKSAMTSSTGEAGSVTFWLSQLRLGQGHAAQKLWERYYERLVRLAQKRMARSPKRVEDEEDVVQSAFATFCANLANGRFPQLQDRHDLWRLLIIITARKATNCVRRGKTLKRGGPFAQGGQHFYSLQLEQIVGDEPSPDFALQAAETVRILLDNLPTPSMRVLAISKLEGYTNDEIAERLGCSLRTVERRLQVIRELWQAHES